MRPAVDILVNAATDAVASSGMAEGIARMGTVSFVGTDGTITVDLAEGPVPKVRMLAQVYRPVVDDLVEVIRTRAGWVCLGKLATNNAPVIQSGTASVASPGSGGGWSGVRVNFAVPFATVPRVVITPWYSSDGSGTFIAPATNNITTTGFDCRTYRSTNSGSTLDWIATTA